MHTVISTHNMLSMANTRPLYLYKDNLPHSYTPTVVHNINNKTSQLKCSLPYTIAHTLKGTHTHNTTNNIHTHVHAHKCVHTHIHIHTHTDNKDKDTFTNTQKTTPQNIHTQALTHITHTHTHTHTRSESTCQGKRAGDGDASLHLRSVAILTAGVAPVVCWVDGSGNVKVRLTRQSEQQTKDQIVSPCLTYSGPSTR